MLRVSFFLNINHVIISQSVYMFNQLLILSPRYIQLSVSLCLDARRTLFLICFNSLIWLFMTYFASCPPILPLFYPSFSQLIIYFNLYTRYICAVYRSVTVKLITLIVLEMFYLLSALSDMFPSIYLLPSLSIVF